MISAVLKLLQYFYLRTKVIDIIKMNTGIQISQQELTDISISLVGLQTGLYGLLLILCIYRLATATRMANPLLQKLHVLASIYIMFQLCIQVFQLVSLAIGNYPQENANIVLALNIYCLIADLNIVLILTIYWKQIQGSFVYESDIFEKSKWLFSRFIIPFIWLLAYFGYFVYLLGSSNLTLNNESLDEPNRIILYLVVQSVTGVMLVSASIWQTYNWRKLDSVIEAFTHLMSQEMNKTRFIAIFWSTVVFNFLRILFIALLAIWAYQQQYSYLIIALNCFTFSAILPISFYLFGFKINSDSSENRKQNLLKKRESEQKSKKSSSAHQTELSHHSQKNSQNSNK